MDNWIKRQNDMIKQQKDMINRSNKMEDHRRESLLHNGSEEKKGKNAHTTRTKSIGRKLGEALAVLVAFGAIIVLLRFLFNIM